MLKKVILAVLIVTGLGYWLWQRPVSHGPGVMAPDPPRQQRCMGLKIIEHKGVAITPLAHFEMTGRVLHAKRYWFDKEARLSPIDLAMGWGPMSDERVLESISIKQMGRFYFWSTPALPIPQVEIIRNSANMHIIPANDAVRCRLRGVKRGHIVHLKGYLVMAKNEAGAIWMSSLTRDDCGDGACEVIWVEEFTILEDPQPAPPRRTLAATAGS
jgi:hypothetical protein